MGWVVSFTPRLLYPQGKSLWYPLDRRLGGPQSRSGRGGKEKNSQPVPGFEPPLIHPVAQRYTTELSQLHIYIYVYVYIYIYTYIHASVSKSFRTGRLKPKLQMVQLSATRCSCITILWVSLVSFAAITLCVASQRAFIVVVYFNNDSVWKLVDTSSYPLCHVEYDTKMVKNMRL
jgi:hypothetical protein